MRSKLWILCVMSTIVLLTVKAWAGWSSPQEIVSGAWGNNPSQFYFVSGDSGDDFPRNIGVDTQGRIYISDEANARIQVFNGAGTLAKVITAPQGVDTSLGWPYNMYVHPDSSLVASYDGSVKFFFDSSGNLIKKVDVYGKAVPVAQGYILEVSKTKYDLYSPTGQLLQTYTERPLELGTWKMRDYDTESFLHTVKYPDLTYSFILPWRALNAFQRDGSGSLIVVALADPKEMVYKIDGCGKIIGQMQMPEDNTIVQEVTPGEFEKELVNQYGQAVIAANGDVYTWKRTPDKYSIIKWTWQDDPNVPSGPDAPTNLAVMPSTTGLYLTWKASPQDPGCVTGYEIVRASSSGGVYTTLATVDKGVLKYNDTTAEAGVTYYYKVRAVSGMDYSPYTSEVSGKR